MGVIGDPGTLSPFGYLLLEGTARDGLLASEATYRRRSTARAILRRVPRLCASASPACMSFVLGLDNRGTLPPFFPALRNSDGIFGLALRRCDPDALIGQVPEAVAHAPASPRAWSADDIWRAPASWWMGDVVLLALACVPVAPGGSVTARLVALGTGLEGLARGPAADFEEALRSQRVRRERARAHQLEQALERFAGRPSYWAADVHRALAVIEEVIRQDRPPPPGDLPGASSDAERRALARRLVGAFGRLLVEWPALLAEARTLGASGVRLTRPL
jgi:hypothetical protein